MTFSQPSTAIAETSESRFDRIRTTFGFIAAPGAMIILLLIPLPITNHQQMLTALMTFVFIAWITEPISIPVTSLLALGLAVLLGIPEVDASAGESVAKFVYSAFSSSTIFLVIGGFILARAMTVHGLDKRFALFVLSIPGVARSTLRVAIAFGLIAALISAFVSNSAAAAMLLPIGVGIVRALGPELKELTGIENPGRTRFATMVMLMIAYGASVGGLLTPIGSTANVVGLGFLEQQVGVSVGFVDWFVMTAPLSAALFVLMCAVLYIFNRPETRKLPGAHAYIREQKAQLGAMTRGEVNTVIAFGVGVVLWIGPSILAETTLGKGPLAWFTSIDIGTAAILAASLLFVLPVSWKNREFTLSWRQAVKIDWGTIILVGTGLVLGALMDNTGLAEVVGISVVDGLGLQGTISVTILSVVLAIVISEMASNTAAVGVVAPIIIPIATAIGMDPTLPVLAAIFGASCGFMLPVSTPPNAIVYGSGMVPILRMFRTGIVFDIVASFVIAGGILVTVNFSTLS